MIGMQSTFPTTVEITYFTYDLVSKTLRGYDSNKRFFVEKVVTTVRLKQKLLFYTTSAVYSVRHNLKGNFYASQVS